MKYKHFLPKLQSAHLFTGTASQLCMDIARIKDTEVLITAIAAIITMITHQRVRHTLAAIFTQQCRWK